MPADNLKNASVLIVDDQQANLDLIDAFLSDDGYTGLRMTTDPRAGLEMFRAQRPDLVLLDLHMPRMDGFALLAEMRALVPDGEYLPVLVLTADSTVDTRHRALSAGAKDFLTKPLDETEVLLRIRNLLETRSLHLAVRRRSLELEERVAELHDERARSERLLLNVLPATVAERLKGAPTAAIADQYPEATVLFADLVGFTNLASPLEPGELVAWLNDLFSAFDRLAAKHGIEKIKTVGDAYMAVGGVPTPRADHCEAVADLALALCAEAARRVSPGGQSVALRVGVHTGPVVAGVIGTHKFSYDLWGDTVNLASRMESHGVDGEVHVSAAVYEKLRGRYDFTERGLIPIKGKGELSTYLLRSRVGWAAGI